MWLLTRRFSSPTAGPILPCSGGLFDQPAVLLDAFAHLDGMEDPASG